MLHTPKNKKGFLQKRCLDDLPDCFIDKRIKEDIKNVPQEMPVTANEDAEPQWDELFFQNDISELKHRACSQPGKQSQRGSLLSVGGSDDSCGLKASRLSSTFSKSQLNYKASCLDDFPRCHKPQQMFWGEQDNKQRPCLPSIPEEEDVGTGVNMVNLLPHNLRNRVDNERQALPQESEPLGVVIVDRALSPHNKQMYSHNDLEPLSDIVDSEVYHDSVDLDPSSSEAGSEGCVTNHTSGIIYHTHFGRPPG